MKKNVVNSILKKYIKIKLFYPKEVNINFRFTPLGDLLTLQEFSINDLENIKLLENQSTIMDDLLKEDEGLAVGNIYALMDEGVLKDLPTGADLGIYDYDPIIEEKNKEVEEYDYSKFISDYNLQEGVRNINDTVGKEYYEDDWEDDFDFGHCILAEENALGGEESQVIITFRGHLEVTNGNYSIIRNCNGQKLSFSVVYMPQYYVRKYKLRNGDEIVCTCKEDNGNMLMNSLLTINQVTYYNWDCERPWFSSLAACSKMKKLHTSGEFTDAINKKFGLYKGDNVFIYLNKSSQKNQTSNIFINELSSMFDKVIYINPQSKPSNDVEDKYNLVKFCASLDDRFDNQITVALLGANYAKRLIEMDNNVAIIVDDIDAILSLDKIHLNEMPVSKTIFGSSKATKNGGGSSFTMVPLRLNTLKTFTNHNMLKTIETLGIMIDKNQLDLYRSYRV